MTKDKLEEKHNCDILICYHNNTKGLCCLYNPDNCKYRQLQKENAELEEKISVLLSCKNCPENKGGYICVKEYEGKCLAQKIQFIKELQKENAELKADNVEWEKASDKWKSVYELTNNQLTNAKDLLLRFIELKNKPCASGHSINMLLYENICAETEQFLNNEVE